MRWHIRLGHVSRQYLEEASKYINELKEIKFDKSVTDCDVCIQAKARKTSCSSVRFRYIELLRLIHTDVMGPVTLSTFKFANKYIVTFTDDTTRFVWAYPIWYKTCVHITVEKLLKDVRNERGQDAIIQEFRLDNGTEYMMENMKLAKKNLILALYLHIRPI